MAKRLCAFLLSAAWLAACSDPAAEQGALSHEQYGERLADVGADRTLLGRAWLAASHDALLAPMPVSLPYVETGGFVGHETGAIGYSFAGLAGQKVLIELQRPGSDPLIPGGRIYVELFRVEELSDRTRHVWLAALPTDESVLELELPEDATYVVRLQPELLTDGEYQLTLELGAVLPFPVSGFGSDAVKSFFGADRDAGARHHEGVDIFAPRSTPVLAVADGRAVPRENRLGGNTIWLAVPGASYYYAHLERPAFEGAKLVRAGEVLGYVGNTGNAATTAPHLHFGVYRWGKGPIDPLPLLGARYFDGELAPTSFAPRYVKTATSELNLRAGPSRSSASLKRLPAASILYATAASGDWLRVRLPEHDDPIGWIHARYHEALDAPLRVWRAPGPMFLRDSLAKTGVPVDYVAEGAVLEVLAEHDRHLLLRDSATARPGWAGIGS